MSTLELHHGVLAGEVLRGEDDEGSPALVDTVHNLEGDELPHCPVSYMDAAPGYITVTTVKSTQSGRGSFSFLSAHHVLLAGGFGVPPPPTHQQGYNHVWSAVLVHAGQIPISQEYQIDPPSNDILYSRNKNVSI